MKMTSLIWGSAFGKEFTGFAINTSIREQRTGALTDEGIISSGQTHEGKSQETEK